MKTHKRKLNIPMCAACILFCLTLISIHLTSGLFARYTASDRENDSARVAVMATDIRLTIKDNIPMHPGETTVIPITIANYKGNRVCEVAQSYVLKVTQLEDNIPFDIKVYDVTGENAVIPEGTFDANVEQEVTYNIKITWPEEFNSAFYAFEIDAIEINIKAEQID